MLTDFDKIFWLRSALGPVTGITTQILFGSDYNNGIVVGLLVYLVSYYFCRFIWGRNLDKSQMTKMYTTGLGTYATLYIFFWLLLFTIGVHSLELALSLPSLPTS